MRSGHYQALPVFSKQVVGNRFGLGEMWLAAVEDLDNLGVVSRYCVADDDPVYGLRHLGTIEAKPHRYSQLLEQGAHRRIELGVDPFDAMTGQVQQPGQ